MDLRNFTFMFYGFLAAWLIVVVYILTLAARHKKLQRKVDELRTLIEREHR